MLTVYCITYRDKYLTAGCSFGNGSVDLITTPTLLFAVTILHVTLCDLELAGANVPKSSICTIHRTFLEARTKNMKDKYIHFLFMDLLHIIV